MRPQRAFVLSVSVFVVGWMIWFACGVLQTPRAAAVTTSTAALEAHVQSDVEALLEARRTLAEAQRV